MIDYDEDWVVLLLLPKSGSIFLKACFFALPATALAVGLLFWNEAYPGLREDTRLTDLNGGTYWNAFAGGLLLMIGFRTNRAIGRFWEGTGLLHQMRGEWFDTVSNCITFSHFAKSKKPKETMEFRHTLVRLMSLCHGAALEEISANQFELKTIDVRGIDRETLQYMRTCHEEHNFNKVEMCLHLIQTLITSAFITDVLAIPPPIVSRVYQTISRGFVHLLNTKKITDTKFPFPYAQLISFALVVFSVVTPVMFSSSAGMNKVAAACATFTPVFLLSGLNYTAIELENPFGKDANDLPLKEFQTEMDQCLLMLLHPGADTVAGLNAKRAEMDFETLVETFKENRDEHRFEDDNAPKFQRFKSLSINALPPTSSRETQQSQSRDFRLSNISTLSHDELISNPDSVHSVHSGFSGQPLSDENAEATPSETCANATETIERVEGLEAISTGVTKSAPMWVEKMSTLENDHGRDQHLACNGIRQLQTNELAGHQQEQPVNNKVEQMPALLKVEGSTETAPGVVSLAAAAAEQQTRVNQALEEFKDSLDAWTKALVSQANDFRPQTASPKVGRKDVNVSYPVRKVEFKVSEACV